MIVGLFCTFLVKIPGTLLILAGAVVYGLFTDFTTFSLKVTAVLLLIFVISEVGGRILRIYLTAIYPVSRDFSVNSAVCHFGGILAYTALFGSLTGLLFWQLVAGKTLIPRSDTISQVLLRLVGVAGIRFFCGCTMIVIIHLYIFIQ